MPGLVTGDAFGELFRTFELSARRLETRSSYLVAAEREQFGRFLTGAPDDPDEAVKRAAWLDNVRSATAAGKRFERVRIVPEPLTPYLRFELRGTSFNADAGEAIRYLNQDRANAHDLPAHDFWLFDEQRLALMYFTADDRMLGAQLITEPAVVAQHERWLDVAMAAATPYWDYVHQDPTRAEPPGHG